MKGDLYSIPDSSKGILGYFPMKSFRDKQKAIIEAVYKAFEIDKYQYVLLEGGTGIGKSAISMTFAKYYRSSIILTAQKVLQDQYKKDFDRDITVVKGRGEYTCRILDGEGQYRSCALGPCTLGKQVSCTGECPYKLAFLKGLNSKIVSLTYDGYYYQNTFGQGWPSRDLMIIDECQNLEKKYLSFNELVITDKKSTREIPEFEHIKDYDPFLLELKKQLHERLKLLNEVAVNESDLRELKESSLVLRKIDLYFDTRDEYEYVVTYRNYDTHRSLTFQPIFVSSFIKEDIFRIISNQPRPSTKYLMMSATILDKKLFCASIGLDPNKVKFIRVGSPFPIENRPIFLNPIGSMSYKNRSETLPKMLKAIKDLINKHPNERGIIHTVSEVNAEAIRSNILDYRLTFRRDFRTVKEALVTHLAKPNSILVASGLAEGVDLKDELSRFQILIKVPYLSLADNRIKRRTEISWNWYSYYAMLSTIQSLGRSVRGPEDHATTYLLDSDFVTFLNKQHRLIPTYIQKSIKGVKR